jgi:hypothetical protein
MNKGLSFWKDNDRLLHFQIEDNDSLSTFFRFGFDKRDQKYGLPSYRHERKGIITTTKWELAESFFSHFSSKEFSSLMLKYANEPDNPMEEKVASEISVLDDFLHYGYSFKIQRLAGKYQFWRIFVPGYTTSELKKIIPNVFQSRTKVQGFSEVDGVSPILVEGRRSSAVAKLRKYSSGHKASEDEIALYMMSRSGEINERDILQARFYRRWNHPVLLLDNTSNGQPWLPTQTNLNYTLENLCIDYPKLNGSTYDNRGYKKDFTAEYLACG